MKLGYLVLIILFTAPTIATSDGLGAFGNQRRTDVMGRPITNISSGYFADGTNRVIARDLQMEFNRLFERFASHPDLKGSEAAIERALAFYVKHRSGISASCGGTRANNKISNDTWVVVTDYTKPITEKRQFYLNLKTGEVRAAYAAHGAGSNYADNNSRRMGVDKCPPEHVVSCGRGAFGCAIPISFTDVEGSHRTQTGFYLAGAPNSSGKASFRNGRPPAPMGAINSFILHGVNKSNAKAAKREIIYHRGSYTPPANAAPTQCGFSWGCPSTDPQTFEDIKDEIQEGTLFYNHTIQEEANGQVHPNC